MIYLIKRFFKGLKCVFGLHDLKAIKVTHWVDENNFEYTDCYYKCNHCKKHLMKEIDGDWALHEID